MLFVIVVVLLLVGAACVAALLRRERARAHADMERLTAELVAQTGDALAQRAEEARNAEWAQAEQARAAERERAEEARRADREHAAGEMATRTEQIRGLVDPVREKLTRMESEIARLERERRESQGQLAQMIRQLGEGVVGLRAETGNLANALRRPSTRGSWGEIQLRNVVEMAGMVAHCDFLEQSTLNTPDGALRPDMLVRLPGGKVVVVDSKVPLEAYLQALESEEDSERELHAVRHARQTRDHINRLASKGYQRQLDSTPEFVVMFLPSDGIYQAALAADPSLIEYGVSQHVLIATPTTLIGLLWAVHYGWRQEMIAESAREIAESARELHRRLGRFIEPFGKVGRQLDSAVTAYNEAVGSFDRRVMPQVRSIEQAGASSDREVIAPPAIETGARRITAQPETPDALEGGVPRGTQEQLPSPPETISVARISDAAKQR
jgi:DNA recombination protein RmuC